METKSGSAKSKRTAKSPRQGSTHAKQDIGPSSTGAIAISQAAGRSYPPLRGDLIDLVASGDRSLDEKTQFSNQIQDDQAFCTKVFDRIDEYDAQSRKRMSRRLRQECEKAGVKRNNARDLEYRLRQLGLDEARPRTPSRGNEQSKATEIQRREAWERPSSSYLSESGAQADSAPLIRRIASGKFTADEWELFSTLYVSGADPRVFQEKVVMQMQQCQEQKDTAGYENLVLTRYGWGAGKGPAQLDYARSPSKTAAAGAGGKTLVPKRPELLTNGEAHVGPQRKVWRIVSIPGLASSTERLRVCGKAYLIFLAACEQATKDELDSFTTSLQDVAFRHLVRDTASRYYHYFDAHQKARSLAKLACSYSNGFPEDQEDAAPAEPSRPAMGLGRARRRAAGCPVTQPSDCAEVRARQAAGLEKRSLRDMIRLAYGGLWPRLGRERIPGG